MGPIARRAEDLMLLINILAGPDGIDSRCAECRLGNPDTVNLSAINIINIAEISGISIHKELQGAQASCIDALTQLGASVCHNSIGTFRHSFDIWAAMMTEAEENTFKSVMGEGESINPFIHLIKWPFRQTPHTLPALGLAVYETFVSPLKKFLMLGYSLKEELTEMIGDDGVMIFPSFTRTAPLHYLPMLRPFDWVLTGIFNVLEFPVTQVPIGLDKNKLPLGIQVVGLPGNDHLTIAVAMELEKVFGGWIPPEDMLSKNLSLTAMAGEILKEGKDALGSIYQLPSAAVSGFKRLVRFAL
jgi:fatty acid amide hydrolase 2